MESSKKIIKRTILSSMEEIVTYAKKHSLTPEFVQKADPALKFISKSLSLTKDEAMMLSFFFENSSGSRIWLSNISSMINVSNIRIISMMNVADSLIKKGYLTGRENKNEEKYYSIPTKVINSIRQNLPVTPVKMTELTEDEFFDRLNEIFEEDDINQWDRYDMILDLIKNNLHLPYCKVMDSYDLCVTEFLLANVFANRLVNEDDDNIATSDWEDYIFSKSQVRRVLKSMKDGTNPLIEKGILEAKADEGVRDPNLYHFTAAAKEALFPDMEFDSSSNKSDKKLTSYTTFAPKQLYYAPHVQSQIDRLAELLQPEQFKHVTDRLSQNGMRKGFACLFYGSPGTGKTETVNQLARRTGRDVLMVDVTQIKSCWVGESEQNIKALFDRYWKCVKEMEVAPILLFNEADAVLGIRQEGAQKAVDKMENSIQNIILQEMENLEGILIATTNLTENFDSAFERRFLYKILFNAPSAGVKAKIWKSMVEEISEEEACRLGAEYSFTGGQIENITRKLDVDYILTGEAAGFDKIVTLCNEESIRKGKEGRRIGF